MFKSFGRACVGFFALLFSVVVVAAATTAPANLSTTNLKATSFTLHWAAATGGTGGIAGYDIYRDSALVSSTTTARSFAVTGLAPTTAYSVTVIARDVAGNFSPASAALIVTTTADTTVPSKPSAVTASGVTTTAFTLTWTGSTDNVGVTGYNVYRAGVLVGSAPTTAFSLTGLAPDTNHNMTVRATDAASNLSAASVALVVRTLALPPSVPTGLTTANLKAASFTLKWTASTGGTGGIAGYDIYRNGMFTVYTTKLSYAFTGQIPLTTYSLTIVSRDTVGNVSAPSAALVVTTPADTTKPTVPKDLSAAAVTHNSFTLQWTASTDNVGVTGYDVLRNNVVIGSTTMPAFNVTGLAPLTAYSMRVKARDAVGNISTASTILSVTTSMVPNVVPTVALTVPPAGATFTLPLTCTLTATAMDSDGTVAKVEFFDGTTKLGEALTPSTPPSTFTLPFTFTAPGSHTLTARATDNRNATTDSAIVAVRLLSGLPYTADFEEGEGYTPGSLHDQLGWTVAAGAAQIISTDSAHGEQSVQLAPGATVSLVDQEIGAGTTNSSPVFVDVLVKPAAGTTPAAGSLFDLDNARLTFVLNGSLGRFSALDGDGSGAGTWKDFAADVVLDDNGAATGWQRLTVRLDYPAKTWDFYLNSRLLAADLKFRSNTATYLSGLSFRGHSIVGTGIDDLYAGAENPLFVDADHDGMDDAWETAHGLNPALNDREGDLDADGLTNIQEYLLGTDPSKADTDNDGLTDAQERALGTDPNNADTDGDGIPDGWEQLHGLIPLSAADAALDADGDGQTNLEEFQFGTDPVDYYNGSSPTITFLVGGDGTPGSDGLLQVRIIKSDGSPLAAAPITFSITAGVSQLAASADEAASLVDTLPFQTLTDGTAAAFYRTPLGQSRQGTVKVQAGATTVTLAFQAPAGDDQLLLIDFEAAEGYAPGILTDQQGWISYSEDTVVEPQAGAPSGGNVLRLGAYSDESHPITPAVTSGVVFVDFYTKLAVGDYYWVSPQFYLGGAILSFAGDGSGMTADILAGSTNEGSGLSPTGTKVALDANQTTGWHRYTLRLDYTARRWDLYLDGNLAAAAVELGQNPIDRFSACNSATQPGWLDRILVTRTNPLFTDPDADGNGLPDAWEMQYFGHTGVDLNADADGDGIKNGQEHQLGTNPINADTDGDGLTDAQEKALGTDPKDASSKALAQITWLARSHYLQVTSARYYTGPGLAGFSFLPIIYEWGSFEKVTIERTLSGSPTSVNGAFHFTAEMTSRTGGAPAVDSNGNPTSLPIYAIDTDDPDFLYNPAYSPLGFGSAGWSNFKYSAEVQYGLATTKPAPSQTYLEWTAYSSFKAGVETYNIQLSKPAAPIVIAPASNTPTDGDWSATPPDAYHYGYDNGDSYSASSEYHLLVPEGMSGTLRWFEIFTPDGDADHPVYKPKEWVIDGTMSPAFTLASLTNGTSTVQLAIQLAVDANRDGAIKLASDDATDASSSAKPYQFWLNDDIDRTGLTPSEATVQDDGDPSKYPNDRDWQRDQISCARDLEDFARLWISTQGLNNSIKPKADGTADLYLGLKWTNITRGTPAIKLFRAADGDGGTGYLVTPATAQQQVDPAGAGYGNAITVSPEGGGTATTLLDGPTGFILPASVFANLTDAQPKTFLLFEGCKTGAGQLQLVIYDKTGTKIGEGPSLYLDLKNVKEMYERWTVGDGSDAGLTGAGGGGGAPNPTAALSQDRLPSGVGAFQFGAKQTADDNNYILYVHGWNMPPWEKDAFAETAFKRLYWQGYKGRFGAYQWPNTYHHFSIDGATDYDRGEYSAWLSALPLKNLLTSLHGQSGYTVSVLAHSMGNVVTGEALRIAGQAGTSDLVSVYAASQAAVPAHCYDPSLTGTTNLLDYSLPYFITTPNIYNNWLVAPQSAAGARSNFYNANDYALSFWETNQKLKPDGSDALYYYLGIDSLDIVDDAFGKWIFFPIPHPLHLGTATDVQDRYEIMARAAQARSKALGAVPSVSGFVPQSLQSQWPRDDLSTTHDYSGHPWHSAQFRFTNADQKNYWHALLNQFGLLPL